MRQVQDMRLTYYSNPNALVSDRENRHTGQALKASLTKTYSDQFLSCRASKLHIRVSDQIVATLLGGENFTNDLGLI